MKRRHFVFVATLAAIAHAALAGAQGINLLGEGTDPGGDWRIACSWTARDKGYRNLDVGECTVTKSVHLPAAMDHWVEIARSWTFCAAWMQQADVPGW